MNLVLDNLANLITALGGNPNSTAGDQLKTAFLNFSSTKAPLKTTLTDEIESSTLPVTTSTELTVLLQSFRNFVKYLNNKKASLESPAFTGVGTINGHNILEIVSSLLENDSGRVRLSISSTTNLLIQWDEQRASQSSSLVAVTFPFAYSKRPGIAILPTASVGSANAYPPYLSTLNTAGFSYSTNAESAANRTFRWIAIGEAS
jgi:hypothetical protein